MNLEIKKIMANFLADLDPENAENTREAVLASDDDLVQDCIYDNFGQKVIPVAILRKYGAKVYINHFRHVKGQGVQKTRKLFAAGIEAKTFEPRGGATQATVEFPNGDVYRAKIKCSRKDSFCRRLGLYLALESALENPLIKEEKYLYILSKVASKNPEIAKAGSDALAEIYSPALNRVFEEGMKNNSNL
jgi:hypothetical protein